MFYCVSIRTVVSWASAHGRSTINPHFSPYWALAWCTGHLQYVKIEISGVDLWTWCLYARYTCAHTRVWTLYYRARSMTLGKVQEILGPMYSSVWVWVWSYSSESCSERIKIVYITIVFVNVFVGFVIDIAVLSWLKLPGHLPRSGHFPFEQPKQYSCMSTYPGVGTCPGRYGIYFPSNVYNYTVKGCIFNYMGSL